MHPCPIRCSALRPLAALLAAALAAGTTIAPAVAAPARPGAPGQLNLEGQHDHHEHESQEQPHDHAGHAHELGPAGATYDLRFIDAMVEHHTGALRMSELVLGTGSPALGALARQIWNEQAREIRAMRLWRRAWYPDAPVYPVVLSSGGDPDSLSGLRRMAAAEVEAMRMVADLPTPQSRSVWFLEGMLFHHGGALVMAHDALAKSSNASVRRLSRQIIVAQRAEIIALRRLLQLEGLDKPAYHQFDALFSLRASAP
ncbi:MAG: DUF305 domain-containing protein [Cyanobacteria bacterium J06638_7]